MGIGSSGQRRCVGGRRAYVAGIANAACKAGLPPALIARYIKPEMKARDLP
jgi:hypothetical protein